MNTEQVIIDANDKDSKYAKKVYDMRAIWIGTFLGGPLTAGYLAAENFKAIGQPRRVQSAWMIAIVSTIVIFGAVFLIPSIEKVPTYLIPTTYTVIAYYLIHHFQGAELKSRAADAGKVFSVWRSVVVGLIFAVITILPIVGYVFMSDPTITARSKSYGTLQHEVYFDATQISEADADKVAKALTELSFFDDENQKGVFLSRQENKFVIAIPLIQDAWNEPEVVNYFELLRDDIQPYFDVETIVLNLCEAEDITAVRKVVE